MINYNPEFLLLIDGRTKNSLESVFKINLEPRIIKILNAVDATIIFDCEKLNTKKSEELIKPLCKSLNDLLTFQYDKEIDINIDEIVFIGGLLSSCISKCLEYPESMPILSTFDI